MEPSVIVWIAATLAAPAELPMPRVHPVPAQVERIVPQADRRIEALALRYAQSGDLSALEQGFAEVIRSDLSAGRITDRTGYQARLRELQGALDGLGRLSETQALQLQITMDRRSKLMATLSEIMKKVSQTSDTLVSNMK